LSVYHWQFRRRVQELKSSRVQEFKSSGREELTQRAQRKRAEIGERNEKREENPKSRPNKPRVGTRQGIEIIARVEFIFVGRNDEW
jgi:hypothetical protein